MRRDQAAHMRLAGLSLRGSLLVFEYVTPRTRFASGRV